MKLPELLKHFSERQINDLLDSDGINPLRLCENIEFNKPHQLGGDYRNKAIDRVIKTGFPFQSTCNTIYDLLKRFINVTCPHCHTKMAANNGGGNGSMHSIDFVCECGTVVTISSPPEGFGVRKRG
jgi:hypothetical protein